MLLPYRSVGLVLFTIIQGTSDEDAGSIGSLMSGFAFVCWSE